MFDCSRLTCSYFLQALSHDQAPLTPANLPMRQHRGLYVTAEGSRRSGASIMSGLLHWEDCDQVSVIIIILTYIQCHATHW